MLTASHNPCEYNGIKFFNSCGEKVSDEFEEEIEKYMDKKHRFKISYKRIKNVSKLKEFYLQFLENKKKYLKFNEKCVKNCIFDCANGATSEFCKIIFPKNKKININNSGKNINKNSGCTNIDYLKFLCKKQSVTGFAFDGDGDRISAVSESGKVLGGDEILYILSNYYLKSKDTLVGTIYTNGALEKHLSEKGISLVRAGVGDKKVLEQMKKYNASIGGEDSGHIILKRILNTGDGLLNAIVLLNIMATTNKTLDDLLLGYKKNVQLRENLNIQNFKLSEELKNYIKSSPARIIIRPSGTEPLIRVFVEHSDKKTANEIMKELNALIDKI